MPDPTADRYEAPRLIRQSLRWGTHAQARPAPADTLYALAGRRLSVIGDIDGRFRPRSNPYDLHAFGRPDPRDPLAYRLQGVWAQPVKGLAGYGYAIREGEETWELQDAEAFTQTYAWVQFDYRRGGLSAARRDFAARDLPLLLTTLTLRNDDPDPRTLELVFTARFDLADAWFTKLAEQRNEGHALTVEQGWLVARAEALPERWAVVVGGERAADEARLVAAQGLPHAQDLPNEQDLPNAQDLPNEQDLPNAQGGQLIYSLRLEAGETQVFTFGVAVESQAGAAAAREMLRDGLRRAPALLAEHEDLYRGLFAAGPRLTTPDPLLNAAFDLARANLQFLEAESPALGRYFYAGLEIFPFWFSNDGAYSVVGMLAAGLREPALNHLRIGLRYLDQGRVPHQISPAGNVAFAGNAQETPLWVISLWEAYRWTGDRDFLAQVYPGALEGLFSYVLGAIDPDGDGYASGPGMVEVEGMGPEKLDTAAYTWSALLAFANMASALGDAANDQKARAAAERIAARFDADWWDEPGGTYAMSLTDPGNERYPVPHWAVITPLEVGLASAGHAAATFSTLRDRYLNRWGLKHTVGDDERVWTLPTALLSRAAYHYGEPGLGFEMLRHVAETMETGSIGLFHELIPEGACFVQLWSGATFLRGVIEDLLGIQVDAAGHAVAITPRLPEDWDEVALEDLSFGEHRISLRITRAAVTVRHLSGPAPLRVWLGEEGEPARVVPPGEQLFLEK